MSNNALNVEASCFVFASAGSGKTKLLVDRFVKSLLYGIKPSEILCLTFTNLAVDEMSSRILRLLKSLKYGSIEYIHSYLSDIDALSETNIKKSRELYDKFLDEYSNLKIYTIHGFCQSILSEFPLEADLSYGFRIINQDDLRLLIADAKHNYFIDHTHEHEADVLISQLSGYSANEFLENIFNNSAKYLHFRRLNPDLTKYKEKLIKWFGLCKDRILSEEQQHLIDKLPLSPEEVFLTKTGGIRKKLPFPDDQLAIAQDIADIFHFNHQNACRKKVIEQTIAFLKVSYGIFEQLDLLKSKQHVIDFNDVLEKTYYLLFQSSARDYILCYVASKIKTVLLDEAQDLSNLQWRIIGIFTEQLFLNKFYNCTVFVVGDIKQSIYRFQNAHPGLLIEFHKYVQSALKRMNKPLHAIHLDKCYRISPDILSNIDVIFDKYSSFAFEQPYRHHIPALSHTGSFQLIDVANPSDIADYIKEHEITDGMILIRGKTELSTQLYYELQKRNVDIEQLDKIYLKDSFIVQDIVTLAKIAIDSTDDFAVACILRSPNVFQDYLNMTELHQICYLRESTVLNGLKESHHEKYEVLNNIINNYKKDNLVEFFCNLVFNVIQTYNENEDATLENFINVVLEYNENHSSNIPEFLEYLNSSTITLSSIQSNDKPRLRFSTIHGAKGLEADNILLLDFRLSPDKNKTKFIWHDQTDIFGNTNPEESLFFLKPSNNRIFPEIMDMINTEYSEESKELYRLLYVALTRPKKNIYIFGNRETNGVYNAIQEVMLGK